MATAGVVIASVMVEEEDTSPAVETVVDMLMPPIVDVGHQQALGAVAGPTGVPPHVAPMVRQRMVAGPMVSPMARQRVVAGPMVSPMARQRVVAGPMVSLTVADRMVAAITTSW